jgi:hypothetical protein
MIIAVDFDGTVVDHRYPEVGPDVPGAVEALHKLVNASHVLILWTMRSGERLIEAVRWYSDNGLPLFGINNNPNQLWTTSPKAFAHVYIDDAAYGCPLIHPPDFHRPCVNWAAIRIV